MQDVEGTGYTQRIMNGQEVIIQLIQRNLVQQTLSERKVRQIGRFSLGPRFILVRDVSPVPYNSNVGVVM
jgi:hypothetical protein